MSLSIEQIAAVSYPAVLAEMRKAANQWVESAALREMERQGVITRVSLNQRLLCYRSDLGSSSLDQGRRCKEPNREPEDLPRQAASRERN